MSSSTTRSSAARSGRSRSQNKHDRKSSDSVAASDKLKQLHSGKQCPTDVPKKEDRVLEEKIGQVVQLTGCSKDEAFVALYDCDNDPVRAIDMLLESDDQGKWVESTKKKRPPKLPASSDAKPPSPDDPAARGEESARGSGGAERGRSRSRGGVQPPRLRHSAGGGDEGGSWKARERRENEKNAWVGRGGGSGARGGRGGRRGGLAPRVFQSRQRTAPASQSAAASSDDWGGSLDAWNSTSDAWNTSDTVPAVSTVTDAWNGSGGVSTTSPAAAPSAAGGGAVAPTDELDEWSGPLTETKVFTPSGGPTTNSESVADGPSTAASAAVLGPSLDLASLLGKPSSAAAAGPAAAAASSSASGVYSQFGSAATETRSLAAAAGGGGGSSTAGGSTGYSYSDVAAANSAYMGVVTASRPAADTQQPPTPPSAPPISRYSDSAGLGHSSDYSSSGFTDQIASSIASSSPSSLPPTSSASQALPHKPKPAKTRFFPSAKIPESAVEMPSDSIGTLSVQFGGLDFGTSDIGSSFHRPAAVPADQPQYSAQSAPARGDVGEVAAAHSPSKVQQNSLDPSGSSRVSSLASVDVGGGASSGGGGNYATSAAAGGPSGLYSPQKPSSAAANSNGPLLSSSAAGASYSVPSAASQPSVASSAPAAAAGANSYSVASSYHQLSAAGSALTTADVTAASGVNSYSTGSSQQPPAPGFGGYVNGAPSSVSSGAGAAAGGYLGASAGVSIKDKLANALAGPSVSKPGQLDGMSVAGSSMPTSGGAHPSSASGISSSMPSSANNGSMAAHKLTATAGRSSGGNMPSLPPGVPMQYFMGQAGMPAFYPGVQQIYGYEDLHALQQRLPHLQQQTSADQSRGDASSLSSGSAAAGVYSDINKYGRQDNSSPVQSSLSQQQQSQSQQQQQQQQTQQQQYFNPAAIPPNYTYYPYLPPYGIYTPLPQAANAAPPHQATTQYQQKLSGYNSAAGYGGYDSLVSTAAAAAAAAGQPDYKSAFGGGPAGGGGTGGGGSGLPGQAAHAHKQPSAASDIYGKMQLSGTKFDNKGFHAATPPPFGLAGAAGQGAPLAAGSAYAPHHMYIQPMTAAQHPSQMLGHPSHHHHQDSSAGGVGPGGGQRGAGPAQGSKSVKPGYSTGYWSGN